MHQLTALREILRYVPRFRDKVFVIAIDSAVVEDDNFANLLLDVALLRSLNVSVTMVHGASCLIRRLAEQTGKTPSNLDGTGITDEATLDLAITAANRITHEILEGLSVHDLRAAYTNALIAHPAGILGGVDQQFTGRIDRVDTMLLRALLDRDIIPVVSPLGCDGEGNTFRLNSDAAAADVAKALGAVKLIYLTCSPGVRLSGELLRQLRAEEAKTILRTRRTDLHPDEISKLEQAVRATQGGVPRVHIIDGRVQEGLLAEVFSNEGIGTLVHANEYQSIRKAMKKDARAIHALIQAGMEADELLRRSRADIERNIDDFFVFEVDRAPVACGALHLFPSESKAELACVYVDPRYENQGIGAKMIQYGESLARQAGVAEIFCLSTQAVQYFVQKGGYRLGSPDDLPPIRRDQYDRSGRRSQVLAKWL